MSERTVLDKLIGLKETWSDYHIGDVAGEAVDRIAKLEAKVKQLQTVTPESCSVLEAENQRLKAKVKELEAEPHEVMWESMSGMLIYTYELRANSRNIDMDEGPWKRIGFTEENQNTLGSRPVMGGTHEKNMDTGEVTERPCYTHIDDFPKGG